LAARTESFEFRNVPELVLYGCGRICSEGHFPPEKGSYRQIAHGPLLKPAVLAPAEQVDNEENPIKRFHFHQEAKQLR